MKTVNIIIIIIVTLILILGLLISSIIRESDNKIETYRSTIDSAQHNIDILKQEIVESDIIIDSLHKEIVVLDSVNVLLKYKIIDIKQQLNEKIDGVDLLTNDELGKFFTERYKY